MVQKHPAFAYVNFDLKLIFLQIRLYLNINKNKIRQFLYYTLSIRDKRCLVILTKGCITKALTTNLNVLVSVFVTCFQSILRRFTNGRMLKMKR